MADNAGADFPDNGDNADIMDLVDEVTNGVDGAGTDTDTDAGEDGDGDGTTNAGADGDDGSGGSVIEDIPEDIGGINTEEEIEIEEEIEEPTGLSEKDATAYRSMRTKITELKTQLKEQSDQGDNEELESLKEQVKNLKAMVSSSDLAESPEFKAKYTDPIVESQKEIVRIAKEYDVDENTALRACRMPRSERIKLLRNTATDELAVAELMPLYQDLEKKIALGRAALSDHDATRKELEAERSAQSDKLQGEIFNSTLSTLQKDHFLLKDSKTNPKWLKAITHNAKLILAGKSTPEKIVESALKAQVADSYKKMYIDLKTSSDEKIAVLEKKYGKIKSSSPKIGGKGSKATKKASDNAPTTIDELLNQTMPTG